MLLSNGISQTLDCLTGGQSQTNSVFSIQFSLVLHSLQQWEPLFTLQMY